MRVILYTGKGGVGKTSIAAATACKLAKEGKRVLIMSTDQAHSLGDCFEQKLSSKPQIITGNLDAMEIDVVSESERVWGNLQSYLKELLTSKSKNTIEVEELLVFPGLEELFSLFKILDISAENNYDILIIDCAPTGETLSLLKCPELFAFFIEKVLPGKRKIVKKAGPIIEKTTKIPMPQDAVFSDVERLMDKLYRLQELMLNKKIVSMRIVTTPEKVVIKEAKRNYTCLHLYDYNVDAVIVNKIYPKEALEGYFSKWIQLQQEGLEELENSFSDIPIFKLFLQKKELKSLPMLEAVSDFYGDTDPSCVYVDKKIFNVYQKNGEYYMEIELPLADKNEMDLGQKGGELQISIKNEKRYFTLPDILKGREVSTAKFENNKLVMSFQ